MPELGRIDRRAAASLAGCAPHPRDSGIARGRRTVWGGRASLKRALFMAAMAARNHDSAMRALFERLVHNGKPKMVASSPSCAKSSSSQTQESEPSIATQQGR